MINKKFEAYKIKREIKRSGIEYEFKRQELNKFKEPVGEAKSIGKLKGIFHESIYSGKDQLSTSDNSQIRAKKIPKILCLYEDAAFLNLTIGDLVKINNKTFKVINVSNVQEWNIAADIQLEVIDYVL